MRLHEILTNEETDEEHRARIARQEAEASKHVKKGLTAQRKAVADKAWSGWRREGDKSEVKPRSDRTPAN